MSFQKTEAIIAVVLIFALALSVFKPSMTGFVPAKTERQSVALILDSSQIYTLRMNESLPVVSLGISGKVVGNGTISIWLGSGNERLLIWSNALPENPVSSNIITGAATSNVVAKDLAQTDFGESADKNTNIFMNECIETCTLPVSFQGKASYDLIFEIEPGTILYIDEIIYLIM